MTPFDATTAGLLVKQAREDDERMTPGEWLSKPGEFYLSWVVVTHGGDTVAERKHDMFGHDTAAIARTRNNLRAMADQLEAACAEVERLRADLAEFGAQTRMLQIWADDRWDAEVRHRPIENVHRRTLDGTWKQVQRRLAEFAEQMIERKKGQP